MRSFSARAALRRKPRPWAGLLGLGLAAWLGLLAESCMPALSDGLHLAGRGSLHYRHVQWASTASLGAWVAFELALASWLIAASLRRALGLLPPEHRAFHLPHFLLRIALLVVAAVWLGVWSLDAVLVRSSGARFIALGLGLGLCLLLSYDVPRLVRQAREALRSCAPLLGTRFYPLHRLPHAGRIHTRGRIVALDPQGSESPVVRVHPRTGDVELSPFVLEQNGVEVRVDIDPERLVLTSELDPHGTAGLTAGAAIDVIATVDALPGDVYRAGPPRLSAGPHPTDRLYLLTDSARRAKRRLLVAAAVELAAAAALSASTLGLVVLWLWLGLRASI